MEGKHFAPIKYDRSTLDWVRMGLSKAITNKVGNYEFLTHQ